ncbi:MAG: hypothetical protein WDO18_05390 [Acidobacteriota bacterium]
MAIVAVPSLPPLSLGVARVGPTFGWEQKHLHSGAEPQSLSIPAHEAKVTQLEIPAPNDSVAVMPAKIGFIVSASWTEPRDGQVVDLPREDGFAVPASGEVRIQDVDIPVHTALDATASRMDRAFKQPRLDVSLIEAELASASRPTTAIAQSTMTPPFRISRESIANAATVPTVVSSHKGSGPATVHFTNAEWAGMTAAWPALPASLTASEVEAADALHPRIVHCAAGCCTVHRRSRLHSTCSV